MNPSPPRRPSTSPWRLRATLALALVTLIAVGLTLRQHERGAEAGSTTTTTATTTTTPTVTTSTTAGVTTTTVGSVTTTTAPSHGTGPVVNVGSIDETARGCGFVARRAGQPITTTTVRHVTGLGHCTVLEIGDSLGNDLGWGLNRELESTPGLRLIQEDISSTGLCATWFYSWPHHLALDLARYHPNLVLVFIGANDEQGLRVHGASAVFSSSAWDHAYLKRIHQIAAMSTAANAYVMWIGLPVMEPPRYRAGANLLNALYAQEVTQVPGATFVPLWTLFATAGGDFHQSAPVNGQTQILRQPDGIHFSVAGEDVAATYVARQISAVYGVALHPAEPAVLTPVR